jgi:hypothetical protein
MAQAYSNPEREGDDYALPDVEVFYFDGKQVAEGDVWTNEETGEISPAGWYWWSCFPGCLPDSDPFGPFKTEAEALEDAQSNND